MVTYTPQPWALATTDPFSIAVVLSFWERHPNGIIQEVTSCFFHAVQFLWGSFTSLGMSVISFLRCRVVFCYVDIPQLVYPFTKDTHVVSICWQFWIKHIHTFLGSFLCELKFSSLEGKYPGVGWLDHVVGIKTAKLCPGEAVPLHLPTTDTWVSDALHLVGIWCWHFLILAIPKGA